jgi:DNA-directed RNA polymerase subunit RPC12/RpoP
MQKRGADAMKSCPQCGKQYPDSEGFCEIDGTALVAAQDSPHGRVTTVMHDETSVEQGLECPVCGGKALPGEIRCNYCGARLPTEGSGTAEPPPSAESGDSENFGSTGGPSGPQEFGEAPVYTP